jgi:hypothetical protein
LTNATVSEPTPRSNTIPQIWRAFGAPPTRYMGLHGAELLSRWRLTHLHTGARLWTEADRELHAEVAARCYGVAQLSRLKDVRLPRWVGEFCFKISPTGRRMCRPLWGRILELVITAIREGAEFLELDYYEGASEVNTSPKTWQRMIHELREAGLLTWERAYVEIKDGSRYRDPSNNLYRLGPVLMEHREALLEGTSLPGQVKRREWNARTLRHAARLARRDREVEHRAAARRVRERWAEEHSAAPGRRRLDMQAPPEAHPEGMQERGPRTPPPPPPAVRPERQPQGPRRTTTTTTTTPPPTPKHRSSVAGGALPPPLGIAPRRKRASSDPLLVNVASLPAPGARGSASPSPEPRAQTANEQSHAPPAIGGPPAGAARFERRPPLSAQAPAAGIVAEPNNAGPSSRSTSAADPRLEVKRDPRGPSPESVELLRSPEVAAALAAVERMFARRGTVCGACSGLGSVITGRQSDAPQRCGRCNGSGK